MGRWRRWLACSVCPGADRQPFPGSYFPLRSVPIVSLVPIGRARAGQIGGAVMNWRRSIEEFGLPMRNFRRGLAALASAGLILRRRPPVSAREKRRLRATPVITSTFENVSDIGVCLGSSLGPPAKADVRSKQGAVQRPTPIAFGIRGRADIECQRLAGDLVADGSALAAAGLHPISLMPWLIRMAAAWSKPRICRRARRDSSEESRHDAIEVRPARRSIHTL